MDKISIYQFIRIHLQKKIVKIDLFYFLFLFMIAKLQITQDSINNSKYQINNSNTIGNRLFRSLFGPFIPLPSRIFHIPFCAITHVQSRKLDSLFLLATVLCLPLLDDMTSRVLVELNFAWQTHIQNSAILMIHTEDIDLLLPRDDSPPTSLPTDLSTLAHSTITQSSNFSTSNVTRAGPYMTPERDERVRRVHQTTPRRFTPPRNLSSTTMENLLVVAPFDQR